MNPTRDDVEALLATLETLHQPNKGIVSELCRFWLAGHPDVDDAGPILTTRQQVEDSLARIDVQTCEFCGDRVIYEVLAGENDND